VEETKKDKLMEQRKKELKVRYLSEALSHS